MLIVVEAYLSYLHSHGSILRRDMEYRYNDISAR